MTWCPTAVTARRWPLAIPTRRRTKVLGSLWALLGLLTLLGLLLAYQRVVSHAVHRGELHRQAAAMHADAVWRCTSQSSRRLRDHCLATLDAPRQGADTPGPAEGPVAASFDH